MTESNNHIEIVDSLRSLYPLQDFEETAVMEVVEELNAYRAIGTIERFKELTEKAEPKKVIGIEAKLLGRYCPICCEVFSELEIKKRIKWCPKCNQHLDWE